jgi:DNA repair exonuclease SbcCD ATPase subunit
MNITDIIAQHKASAVKISELETQKLSLEGDLKTLSEQFENLKQENITNTESLNTALGDIKNRDAKISDLEKTISDFNSALADAESKEKSAAVEAIKIVASVGVPAVPITMVTTSQDTPSESVEEIKEQFNSITDLNEKQAFYQKNRKALLS